MRVENAYRLQKAVAKLHLHHLDMVVWHTLRRYLNKKLPAFYKATTPGAGRSSAEFTDKEVILSLTTYPKRMPTIPIVLESLMRQTVRPSRYQLWLADEQYADKATVERQLKSFIDRGLEIHYCEDLKSHKKYYYAMKDFPESIIITADDDVIYPETMVERLLKTYSNHPDCIVANRAHMIKKDGNNVLPYNDWNYRAKGEIGPDLYLCGTGCAGCLYPPHLLSTHVFDKEIFKKICFFADDIWLKCMEYLNGIPVVLTGVDNPEVITLLGSDEGGLAQSNVEESKNDIQFKAVSERYNIEW